MLKGKKIYDMTEHDLEERLVGHSIVSINEHDQTITLDNGTVLELIDEADCCAFYEVTAMKAIDIEDNIVTAVQCKLLDGTIEYNDDVDGPYTLVVLSKDKQIAAIDIDGTPGSGYYCHSVTLYVREGGN